MIESTIDKLSAQYVHASAHPITFYGANDL